MKSIISEKRNRKALYAIMAVLMIALIAITQIAAHAASNQVNISVKQSFTTTTASAGDVFTYMLRPISANAPMPGRASGGYSFSIANNRTIELDTITFNREGVYKYEIYQTTGTLASGYTYDWRTYTVEVHVDENLHAMTLVYNSAGGKVGGVQFDNSYTVQPTDPKLMTDPPVVKTISGNPRRTGLFTFKLSAANTSNPMPSGSANGVKTIRISGAGSGEFGTWSYNRTGVFFYKVYEENTGERGYTYDTEVYSITDTVTEANGRLVLSRVVTNSLNKPVASYAFNNKYSIIDDVLGGGPIYNENPTIPTDNFNDGGNPFGSGGGPGLTTGNINDGDNPGGGAQIPTEPVQGKPGAGGPKTGDDTNITLLIALFAGGGVLIIGALSMLIIIGKRKKAAQRA